MIIAGHEVALPITTYAIVLDDGQEWVVTPDQRDIQRAELALGLDPATNRWGWIRGQCWCALVRTKLIANGDLPWGTFDAMASWCVPVTDAPEQVDPTMTDGAG
jgi:hypothetical protein